MINILLISYYKHFHFSCCHFPTFCFLLFNKQVLTQEDWNLVLFLGMERTSHWAALYFVALMTFGNYVLFNLLVAILVEGFSNQVGHNMINIDKMKKKIIFKTFVLRKPWYFEPENLLYLQYKLQYLLFLYYINEGIRVCNEILSHC